MERGNSARLRWNFSLRNTRAEVMQHRLTGELPRTRPRVACNGAADKLGRTLARTARPCASRPARTRPEGGDGGGRVVASGTPEAIAEAEGSHTGRYLGRVLVRGKKS